MRSATDSRSACKDSALPPLRLTLCGRDATFTLKGKRLDNVLYPVEESRGYQARGDLWSPGYFKLDAAHAASAAALVASTESFETMLVLDAGAGARRRTRPPAAADRAGAARGARGCRRRSSCSPPISSSSRRRAAPRKRRARAPYGDEVRTVIAGYHWFTDWGRDTMISLEGLTLVTGRQRRGGLHPADLRALRPRRPDSEPVPRRREGGAVSHGRRDALVLPRHRALRRVLGRPRSRCRCCIPTLKNIVDWHVARHALRHPRRSSRRPARAGRSRAIS